MEHADRTIGRSRVVQPRELARATGWGRAGARTQAGAAGAAAASGVGATRATARAATAAAVSMSGGSEGGGRAEADKFECADPETPARAAERKDAEAIVAAAMLVKSPRQRAALLQQAESMRG